MATTLTEGKFKRPLKQEVLLLRRHAGALTHRPERADDLVQDAEDFCGTLLAMAGHDLRQPLQVITSAHDVLATTLHNAEQQEELSHAAGATFLLATMLNQLIEAWQLHDLARGVAKKAVPLAPILRDLEREFSWPAHKKGISLRIDRPHVAVFSQPVLLRGILRNLLRNAIDYAPRGGEVVVTCRRVGRSIRIMVRDNGVGMPTTACRKRYTDFARAEPSHAHGLGLGLFIVKRAAELLSHEIEVHSDPGRGSCVGVLVQPEPYRSRPHCTKHAHASQFPVPARHVDLVQGTARLTSQKGDRPRDASCWSA